MEDYMKLFTVKDLYIPMHFLKWWKYLKWHMGFHPQGQLGYFRRRLFVHLLIRFEI
jgi:hypothetical protein